MDRSLVLAIALTGVGASASAAAMPLAEWPVVSGEVVLPAEYREAAAAAALGGSPLEVAIRVVGPFEGTTQQILQTNEGGEAPVRARLTVIRDGLLDDSLRAMRWDIVLDRGENKLWAINSVRRAWSCRRGARAERFDTERCH